MARAIPTLVAGSISCVLEGETRLATWSPLLLFYPLPLVEGKPYPEVAHGHRSETQETAAPANAPA